jgi:signal transduction histidine kinase
MRHLQFLLLEAVSNALQHAGAHALTLGARTGRRGIEITLDDDGCGTGGGCCIDVGWARGPRTMRERAAAIGAVLRVEPLAPGTRVRVLLPLPLAPGAAAQGG